MTSILTRISSVEATGLPLFIAGINRHFLRLSSNILLRRGFGVGLASSTSTLPSTAIWKRASAEDLNAPSRRSSGICGIGWTIARAPLFAYMSPRDEPFPSFDPAWVPLFAEVFSAAGALPHSARHRRRRRVGRPLVITSGLLGCRLPPDAPRLT